MNTEGVSPYWASEDNKRLVFESLSLFEFTHINEDGVYQYRLVGVTEDADQAEKFIDGEMLDKDKVIKVKAIV